MIGCPTSAGKTGSRRDKIDSNAMEGHEITRLLERWGEEGDRQALDQLMPLVYAELRRIAGGYLNGERGSHTLQATALVHEAYLRLAEYREPHFESRSAQELLGSLNQGLEAAPGTTSAVWATRRGSKDRGR